jgi:LysR family glycine cleavage system transcriptional activator
VWLNAAELRLNNIGSGQHFETLDQAMSMASHGTGVAIGDWSLIGDDLRAGRLVMPFELKVKTGLAYYVVVPAGTEPSPQLEELMIWLVEQAHLR